MPERPRDRNVYVLGAGFSRPAGLPVVREFLDRSRQCFRDSESQIEKQGRDYFQQVWDFRSEMARACDKFSIDLDDLEKLFGLVEISSRLDSAFEQVREAFIYVIAKTLALTVQPPRSSQRPAVYLAVDPDPVLLKTIGDQPQSFANPRGSDLNADIYDYLAALISEEFDNGEQRSNRKDTIITFNYDLVLDDALRRLGTRIDYHLKNEAAYVHSLSVERSVDVLKLYGSLNWVVCSKPTCRQVQTLDQKVTERFELTRLRCQVCGEKTRILLIPPSWDKTEHGDIFGNIWASALIELAQATRIFFVGYSMPEADAYFQSLLTVALSRNESLEKLMVVDRNSTTHDSSVTSNIPRLESVKERYLRLFAQSFQKRRFNFSDAGMEGYFRTKAALEDLGRGELIRAVAPFSS